GKKKYRKDRVLPTTSFLTLVIFISDFLILGKHSHDLDAYNDTFYLLSSRTILWVLLPEAKKKKEKKKKEEGKREQKEIAEKKEEEEEEEETQHLSRLRNQTQTRKLKKKKHPKKKKKRLYLAKFGNDPTQLRKRLSFQSPIVSGPNFNGIIAMPNLHGSI
ncbi:LOW QUALITY PROTEIN: hypothetical protein PanWU01x14_153380, partial [Parasponia andersonii]